MNTTKREVLLHFLAEIPNHMRSKLESLKADGTAQSKRDDFVWHFLLQSFSTMGNSRGWTGLIGAEENYKRVAYDHVINRVDKSGWRAHFATVLRQSKVRMPDKKASWLASNLDKIERYGGAATASALAFSQKGRAAKIQFMKSFDGIGDKYARNIWMDIYDRDFHDSIAIDDRIKHISAALGVKFRKYADHENFYLELARAADLQGWELDRLLYTYKADVLAAIGSTNGEEEKEQRGLCRQTNGTDNKP